MQIVIIEHAYVSWIPWIVIEVKYQRTTAAYVSPEKITEAIFIDVEVMCCL